MMIRPYLLMCLLAGVLTGGATAQERPSRVPAAPYPTDYVQPDGDTLTIRLYGDERKHYRTTTDGYKIMQDEKGYYRYALPTKKGDLTSGCRQAHNPEKRSRCEKRYLQHKGVK